ncbi:short-chain dehydrogenase/reductase family 9C member 7-like isoform X2 [Orbicella faveolata]|uniref:short-chain dehydrogenase/reductase family 9C member 7-like isoform X2 n=1 Tax=Orbicella faveolata TaxID=48498 RepID=UPI0009E41E77|nr:short-chain dehydrogenase/reductase family 9C member 7-like isoform X2 [Orbicella faveolata]
MWLVIMTIAIAALIVVLMIPWWTRKVNLNINGKFVLVTGCDSGFGRETAMKLDKMGVHVLATCLTKEGEQSLKSVMSDKLITFQMDVTNSQHIEEVFQKVKKLLDGKSGLWGLVNNAGMLSIGPAEWVPLADFKKVADVNLWGVMDVTKTFLPLVKKAKGRVVFVGSVAGVVSPQAFSPYCITKYGVEAFADSLRREMRPFEVQVSVIQPGATQTPMLNDELLASRLKELWDNLPSDKRLEYGEEYLKNAIQGFRDWCKSGSNKVSHVIDAIVSPLTSQFPKERYVIGWDAWQLKLSSHLPEVLQDLLVKDFPFKIVTPPAQDVPECHVNGTTH